MEEFRLAVGDDAPSLDLLNHEGNQFSLDALAGKKAIIYFFPAASSPGCTKEASDFNDNLAEIRAAGFELVGISPDPVSKLERFHENQELNFDLLSDTEMVAHKAWGSFGTKHLYGRIYKGVMRSTIVIDETGSVTNALYNVKATGHVQMLRRILGI